VLPRVFRHRRSFSALFEGGGALLSYLQGSGRTASRDRRVGEERGCGSRDQRIDRPLPGTISSGWYLITRRAGERPAAEDDNEQATLDSRVVRGHPASRFIRVCVQPGRREGGQRTNRP